MAGYSINNQEEDVKWEEEENSVLKMLPVERKPGAGEDKGSL